MARVIGTPSISHYPSATFPKADQQTPKIEVRDLRALALNGGGHCTVWYHTR